MDQLSWFRYHLQRLADESCEPWLLLDGFMTTPNQGEIGSTSFMHGVPKANASNQERKQAIQEFLPR